MRNYQARNYMRDGMRKGDGVLFYHSSCEVPGVAGIAEVATAAYPDPTQFDPKSDYFDSGSSRDAPRWVLVDVKFKRKLKRVITLTELKGREELKEHDPAAPRQSTVGDAGDEGRVGFHSRSRMT